MNESGDPREAHGSPGRELTRLREALQQSEARERSVLDALPDMLFWLDGNGEVLDFRVPDDLLLVPRGQVVGWRVTQPPMPTAAGQGWLSAIRRCLQQRTPQSFRYALPLPAGTRQQEVRFARLGDDRVLAMARDLTTDQRRGRRSQETTVHEQERLLASLNDFVWRAAIDRDGRLHPMYFSPVVERITGHAPEYFLADPEHYFALVHPEDIGRLLPLVERFHTGEVSEVELSYRILRGGEVRWLSDRVRAEPAGDEILLTGIVSDVTETRRVEERLRETQKLEELGALAGGIAHDFNNLLVGMLGGSEVACEALPQGHPARPHLERITQSALRAAELCRQMLAYAGKGTMAVETVDLRELVSDMAALLRASVGHEVDFRVDLSAERCPTRADAAQLRQLVLNLVSNAADAVSLSGGRVTLQVTLADLDAATIQRAKTGQQSPPGRYVVLRVRDDGAGMDNEVLRRMFQPFFTTKAEGHGLGLPAALGIVRTHAGVLWVESTPGEGSLIEVALPVTQPKTEASKPPPEVPEAAAAKAVLVIDDEDTVRMIASAVLEATGYEVITAPSGPEGLERFRERGERIAAVVLDMTMPGMGGAEVLRKLRSLDASVPVIVSSGFSEQDARGELADEAQLTFLSKPYRAKQLREAVAKVAR